MLPAEVFLEQEFFPFKAEEEVQFYELPKLYVQEIDLKDFEGSCYNGPYVNKCCLMSEFVKQVEEGKQGAEILQKIKDVMIV